MLPGSQDPDFYKLHPHLLKSLKEDFDPVRFKRMELELSGKDSHGGDVNINYSRVITINVVGEVLNPGSYTLPAVNSAFNILAYIKRFCVFIKK